MIIRDKLPFPGGIATAETLKEVYNTGSEALKRVAVLAGSAFIGGLIKFCEIKKWVNKTSFGLKVNGTDIKDYTFTFDPALVMVAVGGLVGFRACWTIMLGTILGYLVLGTQLVNHGLVASPSQIGKWILWPGVTLMVVASLVSFSFSMPSILRSFRGVSSLGNADTADTGEVSRRVFIASLVVSLILCVILQAWLFGIAMWAAAIAVLLSFALAIVSTRVSGETNVNPVGPMGKVTQLVFGAIVPANASANLMTASVTAGAASQCSDLMHDLKCGYLLGGIARMQVVG